MSLILYKLADAVFNGSVVRQPYVMVWTVPLFSVCYSRRFNQGVTSRQAGLAREAMIHASRIRLQRARRVCQFKP